MFERDTTEELAEHLQGRIARRDPLAVYTMNELVNRGRNPRPEELEQFLLWACETGSLVFAFRIARRLGRKLLPSEWEKLEAGIEERGLERAIKERAKLDRYLYPQEMTSLLCQVLGEDQNAWIRIAFASPIWVRLWEAVHGEPYTALRRLSDAADIFSCMSLLKEYARIWPRKVWVARK